MVFVRDFKRDFYLVVSQQRVLVLVSYDVDSLCACKIIQHLFQSDQIPYTLAPVNSNTELEEAFLENIEGIKYVLLINCGANIDVVERLAPSPEIVFFICDSHRPVDVHNVYNMEQTKLLIKEEDIENLPAYSDVFRDSDQSDEDSGHESESAERRFSELRLEKRAERRRWREKRRAILAEYERHSIGTSAAFLMYEVAWKLSKDSNTLLWLAIIGATSQFVNKQVHRDRYMDAFCALQEHVARLNHQSLEDALGPSITALRLSFGEELHLNLCKQWSLFDSLNHSLYTANRFRVWTLKGRKRLNEFLADIGIPLVQCQQKFVSMDVRYKESVEDIIRKNMEKYRLVESELFLPSFSAQYGYRSKYTANDIVCGCQALLEDPKEKDITANFTKALDILDRNNVDVLNSGLDLAKDQLQAICRQVQTFLDISVVTSMGPYVYCAVPEGSADEAYFSQPHCLERLGHFTLAAYVSVRSAKQLKKARAMPLVITGPLNVERNSVLLIGIRPVSETSFTSFFGQAFEQASRQVNARIYQEYFPAHTIDVKVEDKSKFLDALINLLQP